jgi:hypothetical protein
MVFGIFLPTRDETELYVILPSSIDVIICAWCDLDCIFVVCAAIGGIFWIAAAAPGPVNHSFVCRLLKLCAHFDSFPTISHLSADIPNAAR